MDNKELIDKAADNVYEKLNNKWVVEKPINKKTYFTVFIHFIIIIFVLAYTISNLYFLYAYE